MDYTLEIMSAPLGALLERYPVCRDFLQTYGLEKLDLSLPLPKALEHDAGGLTADLGLSALDLTDLLNDLLQASRRVEETINSIEIRGGTDKDGNAENLNVTLRTGEIVSLVGPTGSGKSQLLADIECAARGDTPTGRVVLFDGRALSDEERFSLGNQRIAQLTQNMNFVIDVSVQDFLQMHARSRMLPQPEELIERCFETANALSGEPFTKDTKVTRLSGGQSRALMIADAACISPSPILLIDEIENAGIDRVRAVELLTGGDKIVLLATHDPLLALSASRRIVLQNGGIRAVLETNEAERKTLRELREAEKRNADLRRGLRAGERIGLCGNYTIN